MADQYQFQSKSPVSTARNLVAITPADTDLANVVNAIYVAGAGTLVLTAADDTAAVTVTATAGSYHPIQCKRVALASTATGIVGLL